MWQAWRSLSMQRERLQPSWRRLDWQRQQQRREGFARRRSPVLAPMPLLRAQEPGRHRSAWRALVAEGQLKAGDTVLLLGTGGVSIFALQLAKAMGATVIITSASDEKLDRAKTMGADHVINYKQHPKWAQQVLERTDGRGADIVVEVGGPGTLAQSIAACRIGGRIALIGVLTGIAGEVPTAAFMNRQQRLVGIVVGSRRNQRELVRALQATGIKPIIDKTFEIDEIAEAFRYELSASHFGKIGIAVA